MSGRIAGGFAGAAFAAFVLFASPMARAQFACTTSIGPSLAFGVYDASSGLAGVASTTATLTCTHLAGAGQQIGWDMQLANGNSADCAARSMRGPGGSTLAYNIYQDAVGNPVWGNAGCGSYPSGRFTVSPGAGNNTRTVTRTLAGHLPTGQFNAGAGSYGDTLLLTITYNPL